LVQREIALRLNKSGETSRFGNFSPGFLKRKKNDKFSFSIQRSPSNPKFSNVRRVDQSQIVNLSSPGVNSSSINSPGQAGLYEYNPRVVTKNKEFIKQSSRNYTQFFHNRNGKIEGSFAPHGSFAGQKSR
jgi:hypothetical protein